MLTFESLLLLAFGGGFALAIAWLIYQLRNVAVPNIQRPKTGRPTSQEQASLSLIVAPLKPVRANPSLAALQADCIEAIVSSPTPADSYMITTECIIFTGTREECADFLEDRGIIPFEDTIEPLDLRLQAKMNELGVRVFRRNLC